MSLAESDIPSSKIFDQLKEAFDSLDDAAKKKQIDSTKGVFEMRIKKGAKEGVWTIDMKKGAITKGPAKPKADCIINTSDEVFTDLASGKTNGQKAFMSGKIKVKGNVSTVYCAANKHPLPRPVRLKIMMATKLDGLMKLGKASAKA